MERRENNFAEYTNETWGVGITGSALLMALILTFVTPIRPRRTQVAVASVLGVALITLISVAIYRYRTGQNTAQGNPGNNNEGNNQGNNNNAGGNQQGNAPAANPPAAGLPMNPVDIGPLENVLEQG